MKGALGAPGMLTIIETNVGTFQIDIDSRTTRQDVATNIAHQLGHRGARVPNSSGNSTWAPFERQVERKVRPGEGLFSLRLPKFESYQPGMLNRPAAILRQPRCAQHQAKSLPKLHVGNAAARTRTVSAAPFPKSAEIPPQHRRTSIPTDSAVRVRPPQPRSRSRPCAEMAAAASVISRHSRRSDGLSSMA